jgi:uncharacterized metal-binding protein YceD (DUF177 family)
MSKPRPEAPPPAEHGFRRLIAVSKVGEGGLVQKIAAAAGDLARIASYLDLADVRALSAELTLTRWRAKGIRMRGKLKADVTQTCVVTLDPLPAHIDAEFERRFLPVESSPKEHADTHDVFVDLEGEDPPEPLDRELDLGEILVEELALALDPYPRKPDVEFRPEPGSDIAPPKSPFAVLSKLKPKAP